MGNDWRSLFYIRETKINLENKITEAKTKKNSLQVQKIMETIIHLSQWGDSLGLSIPDQIIQSLNLKANDTLICKLENGKLILEPLKPSSEYSLDELLAGEIEQDEEVNWGKPEGEEIW